MRVANLYYVYRDALARVYTDPTLAHAPAAQQLAAIYQHYYYYHGYTLAHRELGWEALDVPVNATVYLKRYAAEAGYSATQPYDVVIEQLKAFRPEVVFYHVHTHELLARLRAEVPGIRLVAIPANTPVSDPEVFRLTDIVVGCIPEVIERLGAEGYRAYHVHHGFATHLAPVPEPEPPVPQLVFSGSIVRGKDFHAQREALLVYLAQALPLALYSPLPDDRDLWLRQVVYDIRQAALRIPGLDALLGQLPLWRKVQRLLSRPQAAIHPTLRPRVRPAVYGEQMLRLMRQATVVLNAHIDISPRSASNIRLFEATGMGGCLLTDWKENLHTLFEPDTEVVSYRSPAEAAEKARYLLANPATARAIGERAAARVAREHTLVHRIAAQQDIFQKALRARP